MADDPLAAAREAANQQREEVRQLALAWAKEHWGEEPVCPLCQGTTWALHQPVVMEPFGYPPPFEGAVFAACPASCQTCGYTVFIDLVGTGLLPPERPAPQDRPPNSG